MTAGRIYTKSDITKCGQGIVTRCGGAIPKVAKPHGCCRVPAQTSVPFMGGNRAACILRGHSVSSKWQQ